MCRIMAHRQNDPLKAIFILKLCSLMFLQKDLGILNELDPPKKKKKRVLGHR